jgi:hypothetical protein
LGPRYRVQSRLCCEAAGLRHIALKAEQRMDVHVRELVPALEESEFHEDTNGYDFGSGRAHQIRVTRKGYRTVSEKVTATGTQPLRRNYALKKETRR